MGLADFCSLFEHLSYVTLVIFFYTGRPLCAPILARNTPLQIRRLRTLSVPQRI